MNGNAQVAVYFNPETDSQKREAYQNGGHATTQLRMTVAKLETQTSE